MCLQDISAVCAQLGVTSRTLRFYEQKGIIQSTKGETSRRQYSPQQIEQINWVLTLRTLGVPIAEIQALQQQKKSLFEVISDQKTQLQAVIFQKMREIDRLETALFQLENGESIDKNKENESDISALRQERMQIAKTCTDAFVSGNLASCYPFFSQKLQDYLPKNVFERVRRDTLASAGAFVRQTQTRWDEKLDNVLYIHLAYQKTGILLKYIFLETQISGFWIYYENETGRF